ncbi:competence protein [Streptococcus phocae subsp. salmonis]|nr:competence protein [Streptococcus phocae]
MKKFRELRKSELQDLKGGSILNSVVTVPVILPQNIGKWVAGFFK